jgi:hypothetical protein
MIRPQVLILAECPECGYDRTLATVTNEKRKISPDTYECVCGEQIATPLIVLNYPSSVKGDNTNE